MSYKVGSLLLLDVYVRFIRFDACLECLSGFSDSTQPTMLRRFA